MIVAAFDSGMREAVRSLTLDIYPVAWLFVSGMAYLAGVEPATS